MTPTAVVGVDWIGSVIVPIAAILVSSGIAIFLARSERLASKRDRRDAAVVDVLVTLTGVNAVATDRLRRAEVGRRLTALVASVNVAAAHFDRADDVFELVLTMVLSEERSGRRRLGLAAARAMVLLDDWQHGRTSNDAILTDLEAYPPERRGYRA